jgi:hypothetical protein
LILDLAHTLGEIATIDALVAFADGLLCLLAHPRQAVRARRVLCILADAFAALCTIALRVGDRLHRLLLSLLHAFSFGG